MTGKIEDTKNVAMRIVGNAGDRADSSNGGGSSMMQHMSTAILGGQTLLHLAAFPGFTSLVRQLVGRGFDLEK